MDTVYIYDPFTLHTEPFCHVFAAVSLSPGLTSLIAYREICMMRKQCSVISGVNSKLTGLKRSRNAMQQLV